MSKILTRKHFETSRLLDFLSQKELIAQTGHQLNEWPLVVLKELVDNSLDATEESGIAPQIEIKVDEEAITISDNGPGLPSEVVDKILDFSTRTSSREAYVSPSRGAQGNALKTIVAMPFVLFGEGGVVIESRGIRHDVLITADRIQQQPRIQHEKAASDVQEGCKIRIDWPNKPSSNEDDENGHFLQEEEDKPSSILSQAKSRFLQFAEDYSWFNPHLSISVVWNDEKLVDIRASTPAWKKWLPSNPTDPHWYELEEFERLIAAYLSCEEKSVREFVSEFRGLSGTAKQKKVVDSLGLSRANLTELITNEQLDLEKIGKLLEAMKASTKPAKASTLGLIGKDHLLARSVESGGDKAAFNYAKQVENEGVPYVLETSFCYCPQELSQRRIITGVNWSPGINNPFRQLGKSYADSLDSILEEQRAGRREPIVFVLHIACPKVRYADRGKSSIVIDK